MGTEGENKLFLFRMKSNKYFLLLMLGMMLLISNVFSTTVIVDGLSTTYYVPDDYPTIQQAIDVANDGDSVIVKTGIYHESVYIEKTISLLGEGTPQILADGSYYCIELRVNDIIIDNFNLKYCGVGGNKAAIRIISNNNSISNCVIEDNDNFGILIYKNTVGNTIQSSSFSNNHYALYLESTTQNSIIDCTIENNNLYGIHLRNANDTIIQANTISDEIVGIYLWESFENIIKNNYITACSLNGIDLRSSNDNFIFNNYLNNTKNAYDKGENTWHCDPSKEKNIIGGPYICGNYWSDYSDMDEDVNGIGDSPYSINGGMNLDLYPLFYHDNYAPYPPTNPSPVNKKISVTKTQVFNWNCQDPDNDDCLYEVYLDTINPPVKMVGKTTDSTYQIGRLHYNTNYYWQIISYDQTLENHSTPSQIWNFKTDSQPTQSNPTPAPRNNDDIEYYPPVAIISTNGQTQAYVGETIFFDASESYDIDGIIVSYEWNFGGESNYDGTTISRAFSKKGEYFVTLSITDNHGLSDIDTRKIIILKANSPPDAPTIAGVKRGVINNEYTYEFTAQDLDNDSIQYIIDWGDENTSTSNFLSNGTTYTTTHQWSQPGPYTIMVKTSDNETESSTTSYMVYISIEYVSDIGYLMDEDGDGNYDVFFNNETSTATTTLEGEDGIYLIDVDNDGDWDYEFDLMSQALAPYNTKKTDQQDNGVFSMLILGVIIAIIVLVILGLVLKKMKKI